MANGQMQSDFDPTLISIIYSKTLPGGQGRLYSASRGGIWSPEWPGTYPRSRSILQQVWSELGEELLCPEPLSQQEPAPGWGEEGRQNRPPPSLSQKLCTADLRAAEIFAWTAKAGASLSPRLS